MQHPGHHAIFTTDTANKNKWANQLLLGKATGCFAIFNPLKGLLFSKATMDEMIDEELRHDQLKVATLQNRLLQSLSDGEQKKALLLYLLAQKPDYIILDNPFDNLDQASQDSLVLLLQQVAGSTTIVQFITRSRDWLPFINQASILQHDDHMIAIEHIETYIQHRKKASDYTFTGIIPPSLQQYHLPGQPLVIFNNVTIAYEASTIVQNICWTVNPGECWQLIGPNGSGKTTLLSLITGDNPKAYGQDITLFGRKKGSGEAVWDIKKNIGYFTPSITSRFSRYDSLEKMIIGGFFDSIGLYIKPTDLQQKIARQWLSVIELLPYKEVLFHKLSMGQQRIALIARAMIKHPPLLILDEPISGLDDYNAGLVASLINKIAAESNTAILYVSHRTEEGLSPHLIFELTPHQNGSTGAVV